jgi:hypothetical protein
LNELECEAFLSLEFEDDTRLDQTLMNTVPIHSPLARSILA